MPDRNPKASGDTVERKTDSFTITIRDTENE